jgi:4-hydroxybenzoate polyprenyltransferase
MVVGVVLAFLFLSVLRIMDEIKDYEKDCIVHPDRPLPRGLISIPEAQKMMVLGLGLMLAVAVVVAVFGYTNSGALFGFSIAYLWLMYKEFYFASNLEKSPFFYACTHQVVILPINASLILLGHDATLLEALLEPGLMFLGAFFNFEICRKLDPKAHVLQKTYRHVYGLPKTLIMVVGMTGISALGAWLCYGVEWRVWPFWITQALLLLVALSKAKDGHKVVEGVAALSLLIQFWLPALLFFLSKR